MYVPVDATTIAIHSGVDEEELVFVNFEQGDVEDMAAALPKTASNAPLFALLGGLFLLIAGGMTLRRRGNTSA
jgi:LPXTG-motif cell wall-anchored protein